MYKLLILLFIGNINQELPTTEAVGNFFDELFILRFLFV